MYKELIERLRVNAEWAEGNEWEIPLMMHDDLLSAADAIEKLTAERDAAVADLTAAGLCDPCGHWNGSKCVKRGKCEFLWRGSEATDGQD